MHWVPTSFFLKANALNTVILFTSLHIKQKWKQEQQQEQQQGQQKKQKQDNTLKKLQTS